MKPLYQEPKIRLTHSIPFPGTKKMISHLEVAKDGLDVQVSLFIRGQIALIDGTALNLKNWVPVEYAFGGNLEITDLETGQCIALDTSVINRKIFYALGTARSLVDL